MRSEIERQAMRMCSSVSVFAVAFVIPLTLGCSTFSQVAGGPVIGRERSDGFAGGSVSAHYGVGGRVRPASDKYEATNLLMPVGGDIMLRVAPTTRSTNIAIGEGYYLTSDVGKHVALGRLTGLLFCNVRDSVLCGGGIRAEVGFGISLAGSSAERIAVVPGYFIDEARRERSFVTVGLFGEYTGTFTRRGELPMAGLEIGYAYESVVMDISRGRLLR